MIRRGSGTYRCDGNSFVLGDRMVYLANPGHVKAFASPVVNEGYLLTFDLGFASRAFGQLGYSHFPALTVGCPQPRQLSVTEYEELSERCEGLLRLQARKDLPSTRQMGETIAFCRLLLYTVATDGSYFPAEDPYLTPRFLRELDKLMLELFHGEVGAKPTVGELATRFHLSVDAFSRLIRGESGRPPQSWINERIYAEVVAQLLHTDDSMASISARMKFSSTSHFARFVRKMSGHPPSELRRHPEYCYNRPE